MTPDNRKFGLESSFNGYSRSLSQTIVNIIIIIIITPEYKYRTILLSNVDE